MNDIERKLAKRIEDLFMEVALGGPAKKQPQRAIRLRGNGFETVDLDENGNVVEPPPPCCYGRVLHAPNCKSWGIVA